VANESALVFLAINLIIYQLINFNIGRWKRRKNPKKGKNKM